MMGDSDVWKKTEVDKLISHLGSLLHQEIWPTQVVSFFCHPLCLTFGPGVASFFITTCGRKLSSMCLVEGDPYEGSGPDTHNLGPKRIWRKSVESVRLRIESTGFQVSAKVGTTPFPLLLSRGS